MNNYQGASPKSPERDSKFTKGELQLKTILKQIRLMCGYQMKPAADELDISRKQLEDLETHRNYGAHISAHTLMKMALAYGVEITISPKGFGFRFDRNDDFDLTKLDELLNETNGGER